TPTGPPAPHAPSDPTTPVTPRARELPDPATPRPDRASQSTISYTLRLTPDEALAADELTMTARRTTGRRIERSDLIRALLHLATNDPTLLTRACDAVSSRPR
ncbi:MAG: hypothetical protein ACRC0L_02225, partial [Angustibacter sp.]